MATPALHPRKTQSPREDSASSADIPVRNTPIRSVVITNGDVDHIAGLLSLRERQPFTLYATSGILEILDQNPVFNVLDRAIVSRKTVSLGVPFALLPGLGVELFAVPGKVPLFMEGESGDCVQTSKLDAQTVGCRFFYPFTEDSRQQENPLQAGESSEISREIFYIPGCACLTPELGKRLDHAAAVLFDGTVFHDDEMIRCGVGEKTGRRMGHMPMSGAGGSLEAFANLAIGRKIYVHINNTNPVWQPASPERAQAEAAGWEIGYDAMELLLS